MDEDNEKIIRSIENSTNLIEYNADLLKESGINYEYLKMFYDKFTSEYKYKHNLKRIDDNDPEITKEYNFWLMKQLSLLKIYYEFIRSCKLGANSISKNSVELFKGSYDSLIKYYSKYLQVFSKYASTIGKETYMDGVYTNNVIVRNNEPNFLLKTPSNTVLHIPFDIGKYDTYYVHNPYNKKEESMIKRLLNNDDLQIVYGLYGLSSDKNLDSKINELEVISKEHPGSKLYEMRRERDDIGDFHMALLYKPKK